LQTSSHRDAESRYLANAGERLREILGPGTVGVYAGGSWALGDYLPGRSDLDVAVVVREPLSREVADAVVAQLRHESLPCPARRLELVVYRLDTARSGSAGADFELNLNTGATTPLAVQSEGGPGDVGAHWFPIDRSILSQAGIALWGPPVDEVFAPIPPAALAPVVAESVRWHRDHPVDPGDAVLNACRALRYAEEGHWSSKPAAGRWAVDRGLAPAGLVSRVGPGGGALDSHEVAAFLDAVESRLRSEEP